MGNRLFYLIAGLLVAATGISQVTLTQCYDLARNNYPLIKQYGLIDQTEIYNLANAAKGWMPQVSLNARATYQSEVTKLPFDTEKLSLIMPGFSYVPMSKDQYQLTAEIGQNIWDGGAVSAAKSLASAQAKADRAEIENELYAVNNRVNQLYFGSLLQEELLKQNAILQKELTVNIERITALINNGLANQSDRESLEVELLNAKQRAIELNSSCKAYKTMLGALTGQGMDETTKLQMPVLPGNKMGFDIDRIELKSLAAQDNLLNTQYKMINSGIMPRFGLFIQGGYGRPGLNMLKDGFEPFYLAGVRMSWNLGRFYTLRNDRRKIEVGRKAIDVRKETFIFNTTLQLLQQNTEIKKIGDLLQTDAEIVNLRTNIKKAAEVKLENGVISVTDLIREINAEDMAKQTVVTHKIMQLAAVYNYIYTQGF